MPKATLEFTLPEEDAEFQMALKAGSYLSALEDLAEAFRQKKKYSEVQETTWEEAHTLFWDTMREAGVELP